MATDPSCNRLHRPYISRSRPIPKSKPHITKPLCVKSVVFDGALNGAGVPAWCVGLGTARDD